MNTCTQWPIRLIALALLVPLAASAVDDVTVSSTTYTTTQTVTATNTITATPAVVVSSGANVTFQANARITLGPGFRANSGGIFHALAGQTLPYAAGFESSENFSTGSAGGQRGWLLSQGAAAIVTTEAHAGSRSLALQSGSVGASVSQGFLVSGSPAVAFFDLYFKPVAAGTAAGSTLIQTEATKVGYQVASGQGEVYVYDGVGANQWLATGWRFALNGSNQATDWQRVTFRLDYTAKAWDLYVNGTMLDYDLAFTSNSETYFRLVTLQGLAAATAYADDLAVSATNPLFTDADKDGMSDSWETAVGLNPAVDDRNGNPDGDAFTNIAEFFAGTSPFNADVTKPTTPGSFANFSSTATTVGLSWTASSDTGAGTPGVAGYNLYRNGVKVNSSLVTGTTFVDTGLTAGTTYNYTIRAVDQAGNQSDVSSTLTIIAPAQNAFEVFTPLA